MTLPLFRQQTSTLLFKHGSLSKTFAPYALHGHAVKSSVFSTTPQHALRGGRRKWYVNSRKGVHAKPNSKLAPRSKDGIAGTYPLVFEERQRALQLESRLANKDYCEEVLRQYLRQELLVANSGASRGMSHAEFLDHLRLKREALDVQALDSLVGSKLEYDHRTRLREMIEDTEKRVVKSAEQREEHVKQRTEPEAGKVSKVENILAVMTIVGVYGAGAYCFSG